MPAKRSRGLDAIDLRILAALQRDGRSTILKLAERVGLTARPCLERVRRLQAGGIILGYQAVIDLDKLSRPVTVISEIALESQARRDQVERRLRAIEEIVECWEVSGAFDYIARVVCADLGPLRGIDRGPHRRPGPWRRADRQPYRAAAGAALRRLSAAAARAAQPIAARRVPSNTADFGCRRAALRQHHAAHSGAILRALRMRIAHDGPRSSSRRAIRRPIITRFRSC